MIINNLRFQNSQLDFEKYASQITDLQEQNIILFQNDNPLIYVQFSNFTMQNCLFEDIHLVFLIQIEQGILINLQNLTIQNSSIFQSPILKLSLRSNTNGNIQFHNLIFQNLIEFPLLDLQPCNSYSIPQNQQECPETLSDVNNKPEIIQDQQNQQNQIYCNLNQFYSIINSATFSIIEINNIQEYQYIHIIELKISEINCQKCQYGVLSVKSFNSNLHLLLQSIKILNNNCGVLGCLSIIKSVENLDIIFSNYQSYNSTKQDNQLEKYNIQLTNSLFIGNIAQYGAACFLSQINIFINNSMFLNNKATISGGAIYYNSDQTSLIVLNSQIVKNSANIGGGIYLKQFQLESIDELRVFIQENHGKIAQNLYEPPRYLYLTLDNTNFQKNALIFSNSTTIIEQIKIVSYKTFFSISTTDILYLPSGIKFSSYKYFNPENNSYISFNLTLRLQVQNQFGEKITNFENTKCNISTYIYNISNTKAYDYLNLIQMNQSKYISKSTVFFNMETGDYNLDDIIIYFDPYQNQNETLQLAFLCDSIQVPQQNLSINQPNNIISNYILLLNVKTFKCQLGEIFNQTSGGCVLCDISQSQYSVTFNASFCSYKDETRIQQIKPATIQLRPYFWRAYYYSNIIEECHNLPANCEGGWFAGNPSCAIGHIGALCEQCDLYNIKGQGSYSSNQSYQCSNCDQSNQNILNILFIILWTLISIFITVASTLKMIDEFVFKLKLKPLGFICIMESASTSVLLKMFTNYLQIVSSIASFQLQIPIGITLAVRGVGNPIGSMAFSLNCYLKSISSIEMIYFSIIWGFIIAGMYIFLLFFFHILISLKDKKKLNITFVTTTLVYVYIYLSPNLVSQLSSLISYRNISGQQWIASNVAYLYNTKQHKEWLLYFVTPTFLIIGILLPLFFWYIVYHNRLSLSTAKTRRVWGYLYNEYKLSTYYWETIKIIQKELIILILIYYEDFVAIKACLIFLLLHIYTKLTTKFKPYLTENLNQIDSLSISICKLSIILAQSIYAAQNLAIIEVVWPFYIVLAIVNFFFIFEMISKLIFAYFDKLYEQIDKVKALIYYNLPTNLKHQRVCLKLLQNTSERKQIIRLRFQKIRWYLINQAKSIIIFKNQNNMNIQSTHTNLYARPPCSNIKLNSLNFEQQNMKSGTKQAF